MGRASTSWLRPVLRALRQVLVTAGAQQVGAMRLWLEYRGVFGNGAGGQGKGYECSCCRRWAARRSRRRCAPGLDRLREDVPNFIAKWLFKSKGGSPPQGLSRDSSAVPPVPE